MGRSTPKSSTNNPALPFFFQGFPHVNEEPGPDEGMDGDHHRHVDGEVAHVRVAPVRLGTVHV